MFINCTWYNPCNLLSAATGSRLCSFFGNCSCQYLRIHKCYCWNNRWNEGISRTALDLTKWTSCSQGSASLHLLYRHSNRVLLRLSLRSDQLNLLFLPLRSEDISPARCSIGRSEHRITQLNQFVRCLHIHQIYRYMNLEIRWQDLCISSD